MVPETVSYVNPAWSDPYFYAQAELNFLLKNGERVLPMFAARNQVVVLSQLRRLGLAASCAGETSYIYTPDPYTDYSGGFSVHVSWTPWGPTELNDKSELAKSLSRLARLLQDLTVPSFMEQLLPYQRAAFRDELVRLWATAVVFAEHQSVGLSVRQSDLGRRPKRTKKDDHDAVEPNTIRNFLLRKMAEPNASRKDAIELAARQFNRTKRCIRTYCSAIGWPGSRKKTE